MIGSLDVASRHLEECHETSALSLSSVPHGLLQDRHSGRPVFELDEQPSQFGLRVAPRALGRGQLQRLASMLG